MKKHFEFTQIQKANLLAWAKELETTTLQQGRKRLRKDDTYCCLGIYCNMKDSAGWFLPPSDPFLGNFVFRQTGKSILSADDTNLPKTFAQELGLDFSTSPLQKYFMMMNDDFMYSFRRIAKEIRLVARRGYFSWRTRWRLKDH